MLSLFILTVAPAAAQQPDDQDILDLRWRKGPELKAGGDLNTIVPWRSILSEERLPGPHCVFDVLIDPTGKVRQIGLIHGFERECGPSRARLSEVEFEPVKRWWRAQWARFAYSVQTVPEDYAGPADRDFPQDYTLDEVVITMARTTCFGTCPAYRVQIFGDGRVVFEGEAFVAVKGVHTGTASREAIRALLGLFEDADFFRQPEGFTACMTDAARYYVQLEIGAMKKSLVDYVGGQVSETCGGEDMPSIITRIENEIDRVAGTERWIE